MNCTAEAPLFTSHTSLRHVVLPDPVACRAPGMMIWPAVVRGADPEVPHAAGPVELIHDLRHEAVSRLVEAGLSDQEAASISGHKSMQMLRRYTHLRAEDLVKRLDRAGIR